MDRSIGSMVDALGGQRQLGGVGDLVEVMKTNLHLFFI